jgi:hypothetical protein
MLVQGILDLEKNHSNFNLPYEFGRAKEHIKVMKNLTKIKRKFKNEPKPKVVLKDIQWAFVNIDGSSKKQKDLDREYELRLGLNIERRDYQGFLVPSRTCKQIKEDKENFNQYEALVKNNIEETKIDRLKKTDNFIQTSYEKLINDPEVLEENEELNHPLSQEELKNIEATSTIIDKYLSNEIKNYDEKYFKKKMGSDKQQYFDLYKAEYYLLQRAAIMDYSNIYNETKNFFFSKMRRIPFSGEFDETLLYFAFVKKMEEEKYFNTNFIPGLCRDLTVQQLETRKDCYWKAFIYNK